MQFADSAPSTAVIQDSVAQQAAVPTSAVKVSVALRRLGRAVNLRDGRRLNTAFVAEISTSANSADPVQTAKQIQSNMQDRSTLEAVLTLKAGSAMMLSSSSVAFEVETKTIVETTASASDLTASTFVNDVSQSIGGTVTTKNVVGTSIATTTREFGDEPNSAESAQSPSYVLVMFSILALTITSRMHV